MAQILDPCHLLPCSFVQHGAFQASQSGFCLLGGKIVVEAVVLFGVVVLMLGGEATLFDIWICWVRDCWVVVFLHCLMPRFVCCLGCFLDVQPGCMGFSESSRAPKQLVENLGS